jgi:hypothetical protein
VLLFKQTDQPAVRSGNIAASVASSVQAGFIILILYLSTRDGSVLPAAQELEEDQSAVPSLTAEDKTEGGGPPSPGEWDGKGKV